MSRNAFPALERAYAEEELAEQEERRAERLAELEVRQRVSEATDLAAGPFCICICPRLV